MMETIVVTIKTGLERIKFKFDSWMEAAKFAGMVSDIVIPYVDKEGNASDVEISINTVKEDNNNGMAI